jgi:hypothetical protein
MAQVGKLTLKRASRKRCKHRKENGNLTLVYLQVDRLMYVISRPESCQTHLCSNLSVAFCGLFLNLGFCKAPRLRYRFSFSGHRIPKTVSTRSCMRATVAEGGGYRSPPLSQPGGSKPRRKPKKRHTKSSIWPVRWAIDGSY